MAGKLTIRRVGNHLPHLCLAGVLLLTGILIWLSTAGLPGRAVRYLEEQAAQAGLPLSIDKIQFSPSSGIALKVKRIRLELEQQDALPANLQIRQIKLVFSPGRLLSGDFTPTQLQVKGAELQLPFGQQAADRIVLSDIGLHASFRPEAKGLNSTLQAVLHNMAIEWKVNLHEEGGLLKLLASDGESATEQTDTAAAIRQYLAEYRPVLKQLKSQLDAQDWTRENHPKVRFNTSRGRSWRLGINAWIPSYDIEDFHIRNADLNAQFAEGTITINTLKFKTVNPDTQVSLQAGYDLRTRELAFHTNSSAPLVRMLDRYLGEDPTGILRQIQSEKDSTPIIELHGRAGFSEDYALNTITLRGKIEHSNVMLGHTLVEHGVLSFFIHDGSFNIDNLQLKFPDGHLKVSAQAAHGTGSAKVDLNLPDEVLLALARDFSRNPELKLPEGLAFDDNLKLLADCEMTLATFEPGKSRFKDLVPALVGLKLQFNTGRTVAGDTVCQENALSLNISGIRYDAEQISAEALTLEALSSIFQGEKAADDVLLSVHLNQLQSDTALSTVQIGESKLQASAKAASSGGYTVENLHGTAELGQLVWADQKLKSEAIAGSIKAGCISHGNSSAQGVHLEFHIPEGLNLADVRSSMQKNARLNAAIQEISYDKQFCASGTRLQLQHTDHNAATLELESSVNDKPLSLKIDAKLEEDKQVHFQHIEANIPAASLLPILGGEPLEGLQLPDRISLQGDALLDTGTWRLIRSHYDIQIPELIRVCQNVYVHKGMEIPLELQVRGEFNTAEDGTMHYAADVNAWYKPGEELDIRVEGNPLTDCRITGSNTIPVDIINALIDNADAHWIMRDFRCKPGITRNNITDIDTIIRYDQGIYVNARCKAELINMEFLLGAIRDKEDAQGNPTGEEYLRTDLSSNPFTLVREGHCDVEVLVQLDCVDKQGQALPDEIRINLLNPDLLYDNAPWLKRMGFKTGARTSRITGEAVRFNIENSTITLHKLKGNCYPAYSIGMYYAPIQHFMEDIILRDPVDIETDYCLFPISRHCDIPMQGLIHTKAPTGAGFRFLGTTIPFTNFSGFINISDEDVYLDRMNAECWGGVMNGAVRIGFAGEHTTLDGYIQARTMNLKDIVASYGEEFTPATCSGFIRFQAPKPDLDAVQAYGRVSLRDGDLMQIGLFRPIGSLLADMPGHLEKLQKSVTNNQEITQPSWVKRLISYVFDSGSNAVDSVQNSAYKIPFANHFLRYGIDEAFAKFDIRNGHLITRDMSARGYNLDVRTQLDIDLDKLTLTGDLWPRISSVPTVLISPITILSKFLIDINLYGDLINPQWEIGLSKKLRNDKPSLNSTPVPESVTEPAEEK